MTRPPPPSLLHGLALIQILFSSNAHFQETLGVTKGEGSGLAAAYFGAYFIGPLTYSGWIVRRYGYRVTFMVGLCIYGVGALMFWPSAVKRSFGGFCGGKSIFKLTSGRY